MRSGWAISAARPGPVRPRLLHRPGVLQAGRDPRGIYYRHLHGQTVGAGYEHVGALAEPLAESGLTVLKERF